MIFDVTVAGRTRRIEVRIQDGGYRLALEGREVDVDVKDAGRGVLSLLVDGESWEVGLQRDESGFILGVEGVTLAAVVREGARGAAAVPKHAAGPVKIIAPMPGKIVRVLAAPGTEVAAHAGLLVMEAMKMENELRAPRAGRVGEVLVREGQPVETGALLALLE